MNSNLNCSAAQFQNPQFAIATLKDSSSSLYTFFQELGLARRELKNFIVRPGMCDSPSNI